MLLGIKVCVREGERKKREIARNMTDREDSRVEGHAETVYLFVSSEYRVVFTLQHKKE